MKLVRQYPHGGTHPPEAVADPKLAPDYRGVQPSMYDLGYEGPVTMRPDFLLDVLGVGELARLGYTSGKAGIEALKRILTSKSDDAMTALAKTAEPQEMYRLVKKTDAGAGARESAAGARESATAARESAAAARESSEAALKAQAERIANSKLQTQAQRAIQNASKEESQAILNLQGQLDKALAEGVMEEQKAVKLFQEAVDKIFTQTRIDDVILKDGDTVAKNFGPTMKELYDTNRPMFDAIYNDLIGPLTGRGPRMNEQGGRTPMPHKTIKRYA